MRQLLFSGSEEMPRTNPETKFKKKVLEDLKTLPIEDIWYFKSQEVAVRGIPDLILCVRGKFVAVELKVDAELELLQSYNLTRITRAGGIAMVATPKNWKDIFEYIKEREWEQKK